MKTKTSHKLPLIPNIHRTAEPRDIYEQGLDITLIIRPAGFLVYYVPNVSAGSPRK